MGEISLPNFKTYSYSNQDCQVLAVLRYIDQWNRIDNPVIATHKYTQLILTKVQKAFNRGNVEFATNGAGAVGHHRQTTMSFNLSLTPYTKVNSKWITDLKVKHKT